MDNEGGTISATKRARRLEKNLNLRMHKEVQEAIAIKDSFGETGHYQSSTSTIEVPTPYNSHTRATAAAMSTSSPLSLS
jgi:hypothetical protein